ncbi:MAG TPA: hypothetical protein ENN66_10330 [Proteobacteria bacterium]|nr:hypothetical protein [Pseudomonadota bacterium]
MSRPRVRGYNHPGQDLKIDDIASLISKVPPLTQLGALCLISGKFVGLLAIPVVFIPALNSLAIFLVITWGGLVFTSIALCSYEHFREKKTSTEKEKLDLINNLIDESPSLRTMLVDELQSAHNSDSMKHDEFREHRKVIQLR